MKLLVSPKKKLKQLGAILGFFADVLGEGTSGAIGSAPRNQVRGLITELDCAFTCPLILTLETVL